MKSVFTTEHQRADIISTHDHRQRLISVLIINTIALAILLLTFSCSSDSQLRNNQNSQNEIEVVQATDQTAMDILKDEPTLSLFNSLQKDIHSLATLTASTSNQLVLIAPADKAFEAENLKNPKEMDLLEKHSLMKNSIIFQPKSAGPIKGLTQTYGGKEIDLDLERNEVRTGSSSAKILKQVQLENGNIMYVIDAVLTPYI